MSTADADSDARRAELNVQIERLQAIGGHEDEIGELALQMSTLLHGSDTPIYSGLKGEFAVSELSTVRYSLLDGSRTLSFTQKPYSSGEELGFTLWDGALMMARYVEEHAAHLVVGKRIIELGSGIGLTGMVAAACGAHEVVCTDLNPIVSVIEENISRNNLEKNVRATVLEWGNENQIESLRSRDVCLAADVVSRLYSSELLLETILKLRVKVTLVSFEWHDPESPKEFLERAKTMFAVEFCTATHLKKDKMTLVKLTELV